MDECVIDLLLNCLCEALTDCHRTFLVFLQRRRRLHVIWTRRFLFLANEYIWRSTQSVTSESVESGSRDRAPTLRESARRLQRDASAAGKRRRTGQLGPGKKTPLLLLDHHHLLPPSDLKILSYSHLQAESSHLSSCSHLRQHVRSSTSDARSSTTTPSPASRPQRSPPAFRPSPPVLRLWRTLSRSYRREQFLASRYYQYEVRLLHKERREGAAG